MSFKYIRKRDKYKYLEDHFHLANGWHPENFQICHLPMLRWLSKQKEGGKTYSIVVEPRKHLQIVFYEKLQFGTK